MNLKQITPPSALPVSLADVKDHLNELSNDHDSKLIGFIYAATSAVEHYTRRSLITQTWEMQFDRFHECVYLARGPVQSVSSVKYLDGTGTEQTLAADQYTVDTAADPARLFASYGVSYPSTHDVRNAVKIRYVAGYGAKGHHIPEPIRHGIKMIVEDLFSNPGASIIDISSHENPALQMMLQPFKIYGFTTHDEE